MRYTVWGGQGAKVYRQRLKSQPVRGLKGQGVGSRRGVEARAAADAASTGGVKKAAVSAARAAGEEPFGGLPDVVVPVAHVEGAWQESCVLVTSVTCT